MRTTLRLGTLAVCSAAIFGAAACSGHLEPQGLVAARASYNAATSSGSAQELAPVELDNAHTALVAAEDAYRRHPSSHTVDELAYVAQRRTEEAVATANTRAAERQRAAAAAAAARTQAQRAQETSAQLEVTRQRLAAERARAEATQQSLDRERAERAEADARASATMDRLREVASVHEEMRGVVITMSGHVLFATGEATLLPTAQQKLQLVAQMLRDMPERTIVVDGHTDSQGDANANYSLSRARADSVRSFLIGNGVPSERIRSEGFGPSRPVASNDTVTGRAENRRVEIVLQPAIGGGPRSDE